MAHFISHSYLENTNYKAVVEYFENFNLSPEILYSDDASTIKRFAKSVSHLSIVKNVNIYSLAENTKIKGY